MTHDEHMEKTDAGKLIRVDEAAGRLAVSKRTIWRMIADGQLTPVRIRSCTRLLQAQVARFLPPNGKASVL